MTWEEFNMQKINELGSDSWAELYDGAVQGWNARQPDFDSMRKMVRRSIGISNKKMLTRLEWIFCGFIGGFVVSQIVYIICTR